MKTHQSITKVHFGVFRCSAGKERGSDGKEQSTDNNCPSGRISNDLESSFGNQYLIPVSN